MRADAMKILEDAPAVEREMERRGIPRKDPKITNMLLREDAPGTYRVMCFDCLSQFDLFGRFAAADANGESEIVQRCMSHAELCSDRALPQETFVIQNKKSPELYKLSIRWSR